MSKGQGKNQSGNDQRSNSMNPNNNAFNASRTNRGNQMNPNNAEFKGTTKKK